MFFPITQLRLIQQAYQRCPDNHKVREDSLRYTPCPRSPALTSSSQALRVGKKNHVRGRFPERKDPEIGMYTRFLHQTDCCQPISEMSGAVGPTGSAFPPLPNFLTGSKFPPPPDFSAKPSFPSPPDFSAQSSFPPPLKIAEQPSFPPLPNFLAQPSFPPPPDFSLEPSFPPPPDFAEPPSFPPPPDFSVEPTFPPPNFNEINSADSPDRNIGGEDLIFLAFPNFHIDQVLEFPEFTVGHKTSDLATEFLPLPAHQTSDFPPFPDLTAVHPNADTDATNSAFPPLPNFVESSQTLNTQPVPPIPNLAASSDFPPLPKFFEMEVDSVGGPNSTVVGVGSSFPPIPNFNTDLGPSHPTPRKRARSPSLAAEPKSKKSKQPAPSKRGAAGKMASKAVCQKYRRLGDYREVDMSWIQVGFFLSCSKF